MGVGERFGESGNDGLDEGAGFLGGILAVGVVGPQQRGVASNAMPLDV